jgi:peptidoglycan/xylan/chitin deacetylase (PgdA/CDA1 family)/glycosyltransferase involved in cell wall biosynthesis
VTRTAPAPRLSVVIPTYQRRDAVCAAVAALAEQRGAPPFEVIVVVDGSTDGSAAALRALAVPFALCVIEQPNSGAASARNAGAGVARGEILLFLDDDMQADPALLAEHDASHHDGADVVLGHLPLHPQSPRNLLSVAVGAWAEERRRRLVVPGARLTLHDLLTGQLSLRRATFEELGGFDVSFTRDGSFGGEDLDLGHRLRRMGLRIVFNPAAVSWQRYVVDPAKYFEQWRQTGRSDAELARKHPELAHELTSLAGVGSWSARRVFRPLIALPVLAPAALRVLRTLAVARIRLGREDLPTQRFVFGLRKLEYMRGAHQARSSSARGTIVVLAYHAIADLSTDPVLASYAVPASAFARHLDMLTRRRYRGVSLDELLAGLKGVRPLPDRGVLITFDDCYEDLLATAAPLLRQRDLPAVAFAVAGALGATNAWDAHLGASELKLLDAAGLHALAAQRIEIGSHSRTHPDLTRLADEDLRSEVAGSRADLAAAGVPEPRAFCYPYGVHDARTAAAVRAAGYDVAFALEHDVIRPGADRYGLPRVEVRRGDGPLRLRWKLTAAIAPSPVRSMMLRVLQPREA